MEQMSDDVLLEELKKRFLDTKKALHDMKVMNEKIEKLNVKLAESERLKTNFLSNIRNEINNPLTSILGMARQLVGPVKDEATKDLMAQMIYREAFDLDFQLRNIFMAAELEAGEARPNAVQADVVELVTGVMASFTHRAEEKKVSLELINRIEGQDGRKSIFVTDPAKLQIAIANLTANAIEYNREGKSVKVTVWKDGAVLHISIADEGVGLSEQEQKRLFERFHQLDQGASKKHKGHGLGLCITKAIVEMLGGKVFVAQPAAGGSLFTVVIPEASGASGDVFSEHGNEFIFEEGRSF
jgi:signal transduction histidine kinase